MDTNMVMLIAATLVLAITTIATLLFNIKYISTLKIGGKKPRVIALLVFIIEIIMTAMAGYTFYAGFSGAKIITWMDSINIVLAAGIALLFLSLRKSLNDGVDDMLQQGEELRTTRNRIMANISHEIRTPMNTIVGLTEILKNDEHISNDAKENLDNITNASSSLLSVVNNLIDFAKIESNKLDIIENEYNTGELINSLINKAEFLIKDKNVEFLADVSQDVPSVLFGDDVRIMQAVANVISNACKYTAMGVITFRVSSNVYDKDHIYLNFDIEDTGSGIPIEDQENIFNAFLISDSSSDRSNHGAGLGLLITKSIVQKLHGSITFESTPGVGTSFHLSVLQVVKNQAPVGGVRKSTKKISDKHYMFTAPMGKVLVVDDNIVNLFVAKELLNNYQLDIQTVQSGKECLELVAENYFDIIFMDYVMPEMDGHETLLKLRQPDSEYFKKIPVVALTAQAPNGCERMYMDEGFQGYLAKPIDVSSLEEVLLKFLPEEYICRKSAPDNIDDDSDKKLEEKSWYKRLCSVLISFDVRKGLENCSNDYTSYMNLLRGIMNDTYGTTTNLQHFLEEGDFDSYHTLVHSIKSYSSSAGATQLSFICSEHEKAVRANDYEYLENHIATLISEYELFTSSIDTLLQRESEMMNMGLVSYKEDFTEAETKELAAKLLEALGGFNLDDAELYLKQFEHINLSFDKVRVLEDVEDLLLSFKYDAAALLIKNEFGV